MRLVGVALADQHAWAERRCGIVRRRLGLAAKAREQLIELTILWQRIEVANGKCGATGGRPAARAKSEDALTRKGVADVLRWAEHRPAEGVIPEHRLVDQVLRDRRGLVIGARDLLDDDTALAVELLAVDP